MKLDLILRVYQFYLAYEDLVDEAQRENRLRWGEEREGERERERMREGRREGRRREREREKTPNKQTRPESNLEHSRKKKPGSSGKAIILVDFWFHASLNYTVGPRFN